MSDDEFDDYTPKKDDEKTKTSKRKSDRVTPEEGSESSGMSDTDKSSITGHMTAISPSTDKTSQPKFE